MASFDVAIEALLAHGFATEENPLGYPRAANAPDRAFLAAFPLD